MSRPKERRILAGLALAFAALIFVALMLLGSVTEQTKAAARVARTRDVVEKMQELVAYLTEAETGRRGYVLSGQEVYLRNHTDRVAHVHTALHELRELTKRNLRYSAACDQLEILILQRLTIFTNSIKARQEHGLDVPEQVAFMEQSHQAMYPIRQIVFQMTTDETALLKARQEIQKEKAQGTVGFAVLVSFFGVGLFAALLFLFARANQHQRRAEEMLQQTNLELEQRVKQRTAELSQTVEKVTWLASFPEDNPNPVIELDLAKGAIHYANPYSIRMFPDLQSRGLRHPFLAGVQEAAKPLLNGETGPVRREIMLGDSCYSQTISYVPEVQRLRVYSSDITERKQAEHRLQAQLSRHDLLNRITRAVGERQDLSSIFQVVIRNLEDDLSIDFGCICLYEAGTEELTVASVGAKSAALAVELALTEQARIPVDQNGLARCVRGQLVYEPEIREIKFPFPNRLANGGLRALVAAPLLVESQVFGLLIAARREAHSFSSPDCEFLRQLSEHVALAAHQAQIYSALQQAYNDLRQTQQSILQQERLRALGQMASGIAHDINNAISPVALYAESLLEREPNLTSRAREHLITIQHAIEDVTQTVARMREFYRQREPQLSLAPVDCNRVIQQVLDLTRARWSDMPQERGLVIRVQTELAPDLPAIMGAESEIRDALTNLILNAVDAMPEGGALTLRTRAVKGGEHGTVTSVAMEVSDTGVGMDEETKRRCLEPFFTTKGERGTGLGLAMVYGMVERHSAELEIESAPSKGTTMRLIFPILATVEASSTRTVTPARPTQRLRILIVDDDPLLIKSLRDTLESGGHLVVVADGGQAGISAFEAARQRGEPFALVFTDLGMPYVDGRKVAASIKAASPVTPVVLLTGWGQRLVAEGEIPPHVDRVLNKPPKLRELRATLAELVSTGEPSRQP